MNKFLKVNEIIDDYLEDYSKRNLSYLYIKNIEYFCKQAKNVSELCDLLLFKDDYCSIVDSEFVTVSEGLNIIKEYLGTIDNELQENFTNKINNGNVEVINDNNKFTEDSYCSYYNEFGNEQIDINVSTNGWTVDALATLVHEFFHSVNYDFFKKKYVNLYSIDLTEFFSIFYELDFINFVFEKYKYDFVRHNLYNRYNFIVEGIENFYNISWFINEKLEKGVIDEFSNKLSSNPMNQEKFEWYIKNAESIESYEDIKYKITPHKYFKYLIGFVLSYYLVKQNDISMPKRVYSMMKDIGDIPLQESLEQVGLSMDFLERMNFAEVLHDVARYIVVSDDFTFMRDCECEKKI